MRALESLVILAMFCGAMLCVYLLFTSPEHTAQYTAYAAARTTIRQAEEQTKRVEAQEWGETARMWGMWGVAGVAFVGGIGLASWAVIEWQRERTRRATVYEEQTTQRHLISAKRDIALAYLAQCGDPGAYVGQLGGMRGVFLPNANEFVPEPVCRAELAQRRMITMEVDA